MVARGWLVQVTMQMVRDILMYMDRTYVTFNKKMPVYEMGLVVFRDTVARHEKVKGRLQRLLLQVFLSKYDWFIYKVYCFM